ncbi:hypothetical protein D3C87_1030920 [compost metagenome]
MFYGAFNCAEDVFSNFCVSGADREGVHFLYASYECESYDGSAGVIFLKGGRLYLVTGSHCSCYGLEDQWDPEEITLAQVRHYADNNATPYGIDFKTLKGIVEQFDHLDTSVLTDEQIVMILKLTMG